MRISRQKITYQRNMLIGQGIVITLCLLFSLLIQYGLTGPGYGDDTVRLKLSSLPMTDLFASSTEQDGSAQGGGNRGGGRTYRLSANPAIVSDSQPVARVWPADFPSYSPPTEPCDGFGDGLTYGSVYGNGTGWDTEEYVSPFEPKVDLLSRSVGVISARRPDYPLIALERSLEGQVVVLLLIDSLGNPSAFPEYIENGPTRIVDHLLLREEPRDWFFARNALKAIKDWRFYPAVEEGQVVSSFLKVRIRYSLGGDSTWFQLEIPR